MAKRFTLGNPKRFAPKSHYPSSMDWTDEAVDFYRDLIPEITEGPTDNGTGLLPLKDIRKTLASG